MIEERLRRVLDSHRCTLLGVGPMSRNCVDAAIEVAQTTRAPLMLIASRRQVDSEEFGGGYVENWSTSEFVDYVRSRDKRGRVLLARDHGGPWQNPLEIDNNMGLREAMESAKRSYVADIDAGLQIIHIDPSVDIHGGADPQEILERLFELYEFCWSYASRSNTDIAFEIGTEEQSGSTNSQEELEQTLSEMFKFATRYKVPPPTFVVIQSGTRVLETRNVGSFDSPIRVADEIPSEIQLPKMIEICNKFGVLMKEHNTDYLSDEALQWHPRLGIHSANVAPEFGVAETRAFVDLCESSGLHKEAEQFLAISYESGKWKKWMLPATEASDRDRSIIAGHYVFAKHDFLELKERVSRHLAKSGVEIDYVLRQAVRSAIERYVRPFRLV